MAGSASPWRPRRLDEAELADVEQWIDDGAADDGFFADQVAPIFGTEITLRGTSGRCTWCHYPGSVTGMSVLDVFDPETGMVGATSAFGGQIVVPGDAASSVLMAKLGSDRPPGAPMPQSLPPLSDAEIEALVEWIAAGALDN